MYVCMNIYIYIYIYIYSASTNNKQEPDDWEERASEAGEARGRAWEVKIHVVVMYYLVVTIH